ncbi:MAG: aspartate--tRNA ligase [Clostridia bacterium]|nr:aspartate--tRNA ligase [Clostridia bacterium]
MSEFMNNLRRTTTCGVLGMANVGEEVVVMGWTQRRRNLGSLIFVDLRDRSGIVQIVFDDTTAKDVFEKAELIRSEYVLAVRGKVRERSSKTDKIATGAIEILAEELKILSEADTTPFEILDDTNVNESLRLKYRYLDLRRPSLQRNFIIRNEICKAARKFFDDNGFIEVETPMLGRSTPEGARDYLVPSRVHEGCFYALPQSPQLYKQLLMISGFDRYYQIARCFRDEDLRANRQPEFTQIDVEMSFVEEVEDVMHPIEGLIKNVFKNTLNMDLGESHFRTMTYKEAMENYGSDKPDTRFDIKIVNCSDLFTNSTFKVFTDALAIQIGPIRGSVRAINAKGLSAGFSRKDLDATVEYAKTLGAKGLCWMNWQKGGEIKSSFAKFLTETDIENIKERMNFEEGDVLFLASDKDYVVFNTLGGIRLYLAEKFNLIDKDRYDILWVTEFPMFEWSEEENRFMAVHHPFTSPMTEDLDLVDVAPEKVRTKAYDLVINGQEAGGGSIRIHSREIQKKMFNVLGFTDEDIEKKFGFFVGAFNYGTPPHGGLAFGLDRLVMLICKDDSIRDVIAFPKVQNASCLMSEAPSPVEDKQLDELAISVKK